MFGSDRVMYGSKWPVSDRFASYSRVLGAGIRQCAEASQRREVFLADAYACYKWTRA